MRMKKKGVKRGEEKERKKRTKRGLLKEDVKVLFLLRFFSQGRDLESCGDLYWADILEKPEGLSDRESEAWVIVLVVLDVTDVLVLLLLWSLSSVMVSLVARIGILWNRSPSFFLSFFKKRAQEMWYEEPQVKAPPLSRRRMMPLAPLQNSYSSFEEEQGHFEVEDQMWSARD